MTTSPGQSKSLAGHARCPADGKPGKKIRRRARRRRSRMLSSLLRLFPPGRTSSSLATAPDGSGWLGVEGGPSGWGRRLRWPTCEPGLDLGPLGARLRQLSRPGTEGPLPRRLQGPGGRTDLGLQLPIKSHSFCSPEGIWIRDTSFTARGLIISFSHFTEKKKRKYPRYWRIQ